MAFDFSVVLKVKDLISSRLKVVNQKINTLGTTAQKASNKAKQAFGGVGQSLRKLAGDDMLQATANMSLVSAHLTRLSGAIGQATSGMTDEFSQFETSMSAVRSSLAQGLKDGENIEAHYARISEAAREFSKTNANSASEFAQTAYMMLSAGLSTDAAIAGTSKALKVAKATMGEGADAGNLLSMAFNTMAKEGEGTDEAMQRLGDVISKTQGMFQFKDMAQLTDSFKYAIPAAKGARLEFEEMATVVGQLNTAGLQGSMAGTAFQAFISRIPKATEDLGIEAVRDPSGVLDIIGTLRRVNEQFGDIANRSPEVQASIEKAFGEQGKRVVNLLGSTQALDSLTQSLADIRNAAGATAVMETQMADTFAEKMQTAENQTANFLALMGKGSASVKLFKAQAIGTFASFVSDIPFVNEGLASAVGGVMEMSSGFMGLASGVLSGATGLMSFITIADKFTFVGKIGGALQALTSGVIGFGKAIIFGIPKLIIWTVKMSAVAAAHVAASLPIYAVIAAIALLVTGIVLLIKNWGAVTQFLKSKVVGAFTAVQNGVRGVIQWFDNILKNKLLAGASMVFAPLLAIPMLIVKKWSGIRDFFRTTFEVAMQPIRFMVNLVDGLIDKLNFVNKVKKGISGVVSFLTGGKKRKETESPVSTTNEQRLSANANINVRVSSEKGLNTETKTESKSWLQLNAMGGY